MKKKNETNEKTWWGGIALGFMLLAMGCMMIVSGIEANKTGALIPQAWKTGPMTGSESIMTGIVAAVVGVAFLALVLIRKIKLKSQKKE